MANDSVLFIMTLVWADPWTGTRLQHAVPIRARTSWDRFTSCYIGSFLWLISTLYLNTTTAPECDNGIRGPTPRGRHLVTPSASSLRQVAVEAQKSKDTSAVLTPANPQAFLKPSVDYQNS